MTAGASTVSKTSTLHYARSRQAKAIVDLQAKLTTAAGTISTKLGTAITGLVIESFSEADFKTTFGDGLPTDVTISSATIAAATPNSDGTTRAITTYTLSIPGTLGAPTQTLPVTGKILTFVKSSNDKLIFDLNAMFTSVGASAITQPGTPPTPPTTMTTTELRAFLVTKGISITGN